MARIKLIVLKRQAYLSHSELDIVMLWAPIEITLKKSVDLVDKNPPTRK
ncbi:hypothetical protein [Acetobacterium bakii]|nr:hypothetical protein [Acetobacterium bakii]